MKHRFYYSKEQEKIGGYNLVIDEEGNEFKYTQWCTTPSCFCNWKDAKLVYTTDIQPKTRFGAVPDNVQNILDIII